MLIDSMTQRGYGMLLLWPNFPGTGLAMRPLRMSAADVEKKIDSRPMQGLALLAHKERFAGRLHPRALPEPCVDCFQFIAAQRMRR